MQFDWDAFPVNDFKRAREFARQFYNSIGRVKCPALGNEEVAFNAQGFGHILYKPSRSRSEIITRFMLLRYAEKIIADLGATTVYRLRREGVYLKKAGVRATHDVDVHYWSFEKQSGRWFLKVLIRQIGNGQKHFFSIMDDIR